jgi:hypothetical protein
VIRDLNAGGAGYQRTSALEAVLIRSQASQVAQHLLPVRGRYSLGLLAFPAGLLLDPCSFLDGRLFLSGSVPCGMAVTPFIAKLCRHLIQYQSG